MKLDAILSPLRVSEQSSYFFIPEECILSVVLLFDLKCSRRSPFLDVEDPRCSELDEQRDRQWRASLIDLHCLPQLYFLMNNSRTAPIISLKLVHLNRIAS